MREIVDVARVGRKLTPKVWPNGSKVAVCLSFDTDTEAPLLRDGTTSPTSLSASDYGAQSGIPRILAMLDKHQIPATFFMTASTRCCTRRWWLPFKRAAGTRSACTAGFTN
jgi:peptidoglycan/xylan/chitin deacetylase (PgdA/CDA1 family)